MYYERATSGSRLSRTLDDMKVRLIWIGLGLVTAAILGLYVAISGSPIRTSATIGGASLLDDNRIEVYLDCGSDVVWDVDESPDRVAGGRSHVPPTG